MIIHTYIHTNIRIMLAVVLLEVAVCATVCVLCTYCDCMHAGREEVFSVLGAVSVSTPFSSKLRLGMIDIVHDMVSCSMKYRGCMHVRISCYG